MSHYRSDLRDLEFNLLEMLTPAGPVDGPASQDWDEETVRGVLHEAARFAEDRLAATFSDAGQEGPRLDPRTGSVTLPEDLKGSFRELFEAGWWRLEAAEELGGIPAPRAVAWSVAELLLGANPALQLYLTSVTFASVLHQHGNAVQKQIARHIIDRPWGATMVLTEPDAGTDVGAIRTRAVEQPDGSWHLEGVKRFITSGEHDLTENIVHIVLARPEGAGPGTKGLSMFVVPKFHFDPDSGELGPRNGVVATNLERKMGIKASTTCELRFGEHEPAVGWLVGDRHDGIAQMFDIIEHTRMLVGTKAMATLSTGYRRAVEFARERVQSPDITRMGDATAPRVTILQHPEVRRSLLQIKCYAEGLRALVLYTASWQDRCEDGQGDGTTVAAGMVGLLVPVVKGVGSERAFEQLGHALQVFGGSGYLQDYPLEQYLRDSRVDTLYEGTTAIQANDFFFRKIYQDRQKALSHLTSEIERFLRTINDEPELEEPRRAMEVALRDFAKMVALLIDDWQAREDDPGAVRRVGQNTVPLLLAAGDLLIGYLLLRQAAIVIARPAAMERHGSAEHAFRAGKVASARYFARVVLPQITMRWEVLASTDELLAGLDDEAF